MTDNALSLKLLRDRTAYRPGESIAGVASWRLARPVNRIEVHLCWHTEGRGTEDVAVVETVGFDAPPASGAESFVMTAPAGPYSYDGRLIAIRWAVELVAEGRKDMMQIPITISPIREPFVLPAS